MSAGLDYPGVGPEHSYWKDTGRVDYLECGDDAAMAAFDNLARTEGIIAALESSHAVAKAMKLAAEMPTDQNLVVCLSGRGDKDAMEIARLRGEGMLLEGPVPADTAFNPGRIAKCDAVVAMYHDQGLPVLKHMGFGRAVNITLGLPFIRTSVDHGTALDIAWQGKANVTSLIEAVLLAAALA